MIGSFAAILVTLLVMHNLADHIFGQTDTIAAHKADKGLAGWKHIFSHVILYHACLMVGLGSVLIVLDIPVTWLGVISGLLFSAVTHAIIDRRKIVRWILEVTDSPGFAKMETPLNGMYLADQGLHWGCLLISALLMVGL